MATQNLANVEEEWMKKRKGFIMDLEGEVGGVHPICSFMWADNFWIISHSFDQVLTEQGDLLYKYLEQFFRA